MTNTARKRRRDGETRSFVAWSRRAARAPPRWHPCARRDRPTARTRASPGPKARARRARRRNGRTARARGPGLPPKAILPLAGHFTARGGTGIRASLAPNRGASLKWMHKGPRRILRRGPCFWADPGSRACATECRLPRAGAPRYTTVTQPDA